MRAITGVVHQRCARWGGRIALATVASLALLSAMLIHAASEASDASRLEQRVSDPSGRAEGRLRWDEAYIEVRASGTADRALAVNRAQERLHALTAARNVGFAMLAEMVHGVTIDGSTLVRNAVLVEDVVRTRVQGRVRGSVVSEDVKQLSDGSLLAEVVMRLPLRGEKSLVESLAPWLAARPADPYRADPSSRVTDRYTGLIVDASDTSFSTAVAPLLVEEGSRKVVFGPHMVQFASLADHGAVSYAHGLADARRDARLGANPLIVRAPEAAGARKGDLVLSRQDAERVLAADRDAAFLSKGAVVIVLGKDRTELARKPGKHLALVIGIDEYGTGAGTFPSLRYAAGDAQALAAVLSQRASVRSGDLTLLLNSAATRERILQALGTLRDQARDEDRVTIYFAGHGSVGSGDDGRSHYFLVPGNGRPDALAKTALIDDVLEERIGQIPSRQVVVILDTCYAAAAGATGVRVRGFGVAADAAARPARRPLEATAGRVIVSASKPEQVAFEDDARGSGLFTSFVLEGLRGRADLDGNGTITALELFQYVAPRVADYSRDRYRVEQTPVLDVRGLSAEQLALVNMR